MFKSGIHFEKIITTPSDRQSCIVVGRVLDQDIKPCFAVINRGLETQAVISPGQFYYDSLQGEEFKMFVTPSQLNMTQNPLIIESQPLIQLYGTFTSNSKIKLGNQGGKPEVINSDPGSFSANEKIEIMFSTFVVSNLDVKQINMTIEQAMQASSLISSCSQLQQAKIGPPAALINRLQSNVSVKPFQMPV